MTQTSIFMHEIKNSLSNIYSLVDLIHLDPQDADKYLQLIKDSVDQIKAVELDYDTYRKSGKRPIKLSVVNLQTLLKDILSEYKSMIESYDIEVINQSKSIKIMTDVSKLKQVLSNLISNAIKYNRDTEGKILIQTGIEGRNTVYIKISDTGIGMTPKELKQLGNQLFYRSKKKEAPGTGLGWSIIRTLADIMHWDIQIKSGNTEEYTTSVKLIVV